MFAFAADGRPSAPLVPMRPVADQFRLAWQRVLASDAPSYGKL